MTYQAIIDYLFNLQKHGIKLGLENSLKLMSFLGEPHKKFRSVHIAGTNGKGSTASFIAAVLRSAGYRVGLYTSPHLVDFTERIRINNIQIPEKKVIELARRVREASLPHASKDHPEQFSPTFFEVTTAMAFAYFAEEGVEIAVLEAGMGGRMDSTNVITPLLSIITNIELEHTEFLGDTLEKIAAEKAGIIKEKVPVITGASQPEVLAVIEREAHSRHAPVFTFAKDFKTAGPVSGLDPVFDYYGIDHAIRGVRIGMLGRHQVDNAALALAGVECLRRSGMSIPEAALREGIGQTRWEGRMERVSSRPDIYLDGAHNPASARVLLQAIKEIKHSYRKIVLVLGILADKDYRGILTELVPIADHIIVTRAQYARAMEAAALAEELRAHSVRQASSVAEAIAAATRIASEDDLILVTGSLYVVGEARAFLVPDQQRSHAFNSLKG